MKKTMIGAMIFVFMIMFCGCSKPAESETVAFNKPQYEWGNVKNATLTVWGDEPELNRIYVKRALARYQELTGNKLEVRILTKEEIDTLLPEVYNTQGAEMPDVLLTYGGTNIDNLNPDKNFYDFTNAQWVEDLTDTSINQTIYNGKVIGLPHGEASISGMIYNKTLFEKYNISVPKNQQQFLEACETLLSNGIAPVYLPYADITMLLYQFPMDSILEDKDILDGINNGSLSYSDIPEMEKIVQWYKLMSDKGYFGENYTTNNGIGMDEAMKSEKYAMVIAWDTWLYTNFTGDASKFGLMPAFMSIPDKGSFEGPNIVMYTVNKNSPRIEASLDFITFLADPYNYNVIFEGIYTAPVFKKQIGSISTPQYAEAEALIEQLYFDSTAWQRIKGFSQIDARYIQKYMTTEGYSVQDCLKDMDNARIKRAAGQ